MKAIYLDGNELQWRETEQPVSGSQEVLIEVFATTINRADLVQRAGRYNPPAGASEILGLEAAGLVVNIGADVKHLKVGDRVCALLTGGGYAEYATAHAGHCFLIPDAWDFTYAAAIPEVFITAYLNLFEEGRLQTGGRALIWAAASGVGTAALQLCREEKIVVDAICSAPKHERIREFEPSSIFDRNSPDLKEQLQNKRYDMILDPVGGSNLTMNVNLLSRRGRLVVIGLLGGREGTLPIGRLLVNRLQVIGSVLRSRPPEEKTEIIDRFKAKFWPMLVDKRIVPIIDVVLPIEEVDTGHQKIASNSTIGKVVLIVKDS